MKDNRESEISIPIEGESISLVGNLIVPAEAKSIVIFSHGSGSSRFSPRNNYVAKILNDRKIATLLIDLLTPQEDITYKNRFDIDLLTQRLIAVTDFVRKTPALKDFHIGYFGASTGSASALEAAAGTGEIVEAIVSRGGRPDLAKLVLPLVKSPTLLIVGGLDGDVIEMNREAYNELNCEKKMVIVKGASHLFEEEGKLEEVSKLAVEWFELYFVQNDRLIAKNKTHFI